MCGFTVCISKNKINYPLLRKINKLIAHRGPDSEKFFSSQSLKFKSKLNFFFGFRRLKIIDLNKRSDQPFIYKNKFIILFNGEIYNYIEIKNYLKKKNYCFKTKSDTEVIAAAFDFWGEKCFANFHGMWSLVIFDIRKKEFIVCRDRYGVKPLYYYSNSKGDVFFSSEIKQLTPLIKKKYINKKIIADYLLRDLQNHTNETFFKNIFQVDPGSLIRINENLKINKKKWYKFPHKKRSITNKNNLKEILLKSINLRLRSDVKIGITLSGGIDSTAIASVVASIKKNDYKKIITFTTLTGDQNDESNYVDEFNKKYKFKNIKINLKFKDFKKDINKILSKHDEPIPNLTIFSEWRVFKEMKKYGIKVNLDGHSADEIFCGYEKYFALNLKNHLLNFEYKKFAKFFIDLFKEKIPNKKKYLLRIISNILNIEFIKSIYLNSFDKNWIKYEKKNNISYKKITNNFVLNENYNQFFFTSLPKQLRWSDLNSMSHSIETRSPFIDHKVVENVLLSKSENKINSHISKYILREAVKKYLPSAIYDRKFKVGFTAPEEKWLKENKIYIRGLFNKSFKYCKNFLQQSCKKKGLKIIDGSEKYNPWIWKVIFLGLWIKKNKIITHD